MSKDKVIPVSPSLDSPDWLFYCEGCDEHHGVWTTKPIIVDGKPNIWTFNGDKENPTFRPSIHIKRQRTGSQEKETICHSIVTDGKIQYLSDCKHDLKGQTINLLHLLCHFHMILVFSYFVALKST